MTTKSNPVPERGKKNYLEFIQSPEGRTLRILAEFLEPQHRLRDAGITQTVVFFGSARTPSRRGLTKQLREARHAATEHPGKRADRRIAAVEQQLRMSRTYEDAVQLARRITEWAVQDANPQQNLVVCTGGGPGVMEAGNRGAILGGGRSLGLNIALPFEQRLNPFISDDLDFEFAYFFARKFWFVSLARAMVCMPGGFGTLDELFEVLTLIQTGRSPRVPIVLFGKEFWDRVVDLDFLLSEGYISPEDLDLFTVFDDVDAAADFIIDAISSTPQ